MSSNTPAPAAMAPNQLVTESIRQYMTLIDLWDLVNIQDKHNWFDRSCVDRSPGSSYDNFSFAVSKFLYFVSTKFPAPKYNSDRSNQIELDAIGILWGNDVELKALTYGSTEYNQLKELKIKRMYDIPPSILLEVLPIYFARDMIGIRKMRFDIKKTFMHHCIDVCGWSEFADRYCYLILAM